MNINELNVRLTEDNFIAEAWYALIASDLIKADDIINYFTSAEKDADDLSWIESHMIKALIEADDLDFTSTDAQRYLRSFIK